MIQELSKIFKVTDKGAEFIFLLLLRCPFDALLTIIQASFLQFTFHAIDNKNENNLLAACATFGIASLLLFLYNGTVWSIYAPFVIRLISKLRNKLFYKISVTSLPQIEARSIGEWFTRLNTDVQLTAAMLSQPLHLPHAVVSVVNICISAVILLSMNTSIFMLAILFVIPHILISQLFIAKPMTALTIKSQNAVAQNATDLSSFVTCADIAVLYNANDFLMKQFEKSSLNLRKVNMKMRKRSAAGNALMPVMGIGGYLIILLTGGMWIFAGKLTLSELTAALQYRGGILASALMLINSLISIRAAMAGVCRVNETLNIEAEV